MQTNRRSILGMTAAILAVPFVGMGAAMKSMKKIKVKSFTDSTVELSFPDEKTRKSFWVTFTDIMWPKGDDGKRSNEKSFERVYGPILRGEGDYGGFTSTLGRSGFFDTYAVKTAIKLYEQGILLEVIKVEKGPGYHHETVVVPEFYEFTETRARI